MFTLHFFFFISKCSHYIFVCFLFLWRPIANDFQSDVLEENIYATSMVNGAEVRLSIPEFWLLHLYVARILRILVIFKKFM